MGQEQNEIAIDFQYVASPDADERVAESYDLILDLILNELANSEKDGEACSTPSE